MIRWIRRFSCSKRLRRATLAFIGAELLVSGLLLLFPASVFADDCNQDWTRAED